MARGKVKSYSDDRLVALLAAGDLTYAQIGEQVGLSEAHVAKIARGRRRRKLQARIRAMREYYIDRSRFMAASWVCRLLKKHIAVGMAGTDETARKCREFTMDRVGLGRDRR